MSIAQPTVHSHCNVAGSGPVELHIKNQHAIDCVDAALAALDNAKPLARDYCEQGEAVRLAATTEHWHRVKALRAIREDLARINHHILNNR